MKDGDLVELIQPGGEAAELMGCTGELSVGSMDNSGPSDRRRGYWSAGTLAVFIDSLPNVYHQLASVVLIDGSTGWVWNDEIRLVSTSYNRGDQ